MLRAVISTLDSVRKSNDLANAFLNAVLNPGRVGGIWGEWEGGFLNAALNPGRVGGIWGELWEEIKRFVGGVGQSCPNFEAGVV